MDWVSFQIKESSILSDTQFPQPPPPPTLAAAAAASGGGFNLENKVSPSILLIIIILAIIFFISGLLHLLVRFMIRPGSAAGRGGDADYELDSVTALQGQLQQLFHLHDAGVDQSFIDTLPIFLYDSIVGGPADKSSAPFDCAVCLCEFAADDKLRLLPKCSHAFHMECIDTWLLSHSTCPLCRSSLLADFTAANHGSGNGSSNLLPCSPIVLVLESGSERSSREMETNNNNLGRTNSIVSACSLVGYQGDNESGSCRVENPPPEAAETGSGSGRDRVVRVKLGKFRNVEGSGNVNGSGNGDDNVRRCYSMGSFEYVMDESSSLQVPIRFSPAAAKKSKPEHRSAMSVCGCESAREFGRFGEGNASIVPAGNGGRESFSISKIWSRGGGKKSEEKQGISETGEELGSTRRGVSFRFPASSELGFSGEQSCSGGNGGGGELGEGKTPSFARRTLLWLAGKQNKVVHSNFTSDV